MQQPLRQAGINERMRHSPSIPALYESKHIAAHKKAGAVSLQGEGGHLRCTSFCPLLWFLLGLPALLSSTTLLSFVTQPT